MQFASGDAIIHPMYGAGVVERIVERAIQGSTELYYRIRLLGQTGTVLMVPTAAAERLGLRGAITRSDLGQLWCVLCAAPGALPDDSKELRLLVQVKLSSGDIFQVAEVVRDIAWRQVKMHSSTSTRQYEEGIKLLVGEIAATEGIEFDDAEAQLRARLREHMTTASMN
jgi:CarD family transcriptional regulator